MSQLKEVYSRNTCAICLGYNPLKVVAHGIDKGQLVIFSAKLQAVIFLTTASVRNC
jgi:hypothetical protein